MPRRRGQPNTPVSRGEDALEALHALAERETNYAHVILNWGQRLLDLEGVSLRNGMNREADGSDMSSYAIAFTHPIRNTTFVGFLTNRQDWRPGRYPQRDFGIRIRIKETVVSHVQDPLHLLEGPTRESTRDWYNFRRTDESSIGPAFDTIRRVYDHWD